MSKQMQATESLNGQNLAKSRSASYPEQVSLASAFEAGSEEMVQGQLGQFADPRLPVGQRQAVASRIGQLAGNGYLQRALVEPRQNRELVQEGKPSNVSVNTTLNSTHSYVQTQPEAPGNDAESIGEQLRSHRQDVGARIDDVRLQAGQIFDSAQLSVNNLVHTTQAVLREVNAWRRTVDQSVLREFETTYADALGSGLREGGGLVISMVVESNPVAKSVYNAVDIALKMWDVASDARAVVRSQELIGVSRTAHTLAVEAEDAIIEEIVRGQHSAFTAFNILYGRFLQTTDRGEGGSYGIVDAQATREEEQLAQLPLRGRLQPRDRQDVDAVCADLRRVVNQADQSLRQLQQLHAALQRLPDHIQREGRQRLILAQTLFARRGSDSELRMTGQLIREGQYLRLTVDRNIGSGDHNTRLSRRTTWGDFEQLGISVALVLQVIKSRIVGQIFGPLERRRFSTHEMVTIHLRGSGMVQWDGMDDETIGLLLLTHTDLVDIAATADIRERAPAVGQSVKRQVELMLFNLPLAKLYEARI